MFQITRRDVKNRRLVVIASGFDFVALLSGCMTAGSIDIVRVPVGISLVCVVTVAVFIFGFAGVDYAELIIIGGG